MNIVEHELKTLELGRFQFKEALKCIFHTIIFNRALGMCTPKEENSDVFENITYVRCDDPEIDSYIESRIDACAKSLPKEGDTGIPVYLSFYTKNGGGFFKKEEKVYWERWRVNIAIQKAKGPGSAEKRSASLRDRLNDVIQAINDHKEHIPPVKAEGSLVFPYHITFGDNIGDEDNWVVRLLKQGPPMVLKLGT